MAQVTIGSFGTACRAVSELVWRWHGPPTWRWNGAERVGRGRPWKAMMFYYGMIIVWKAMFGRPYHGYNML